MNSFSRYHFILNVSDTAVISSQLTNALQLPLLILTESAAWVSEDDIKPHKKSSNSLFDKLFKLFNINLSRGFRDFN